MGKRCCLSVREVLLLFSYLVPDFLPVLTLRWLLPLEDGWLRVSPRAAAAPLHGGQQARRAGGAGGHQHTHGLADRSSSRLLLRTSRAETLPQMVRVAPPLNKKGGGYQLSFPFFRPRKTKLS